MKNSLLYLVSYLKQTERKLRRTWTRGHGIFPFQTKHTRALYGTDAHRISSIFIKVYPPFTGSGIVKLYGRWFDIKKALFYSLVPLIIINNAQGDTLFAANDPRINYFGRIDFSDPASARFTWSGTAIEARFPGPSIGFRLVDGSADYDVEIDGVPDTVLRSEFEIRDYYVGNDLSEGEHTIRIIRRSENHYSAGIFRGFYLPEGRELLPPPGKPARKIEFIGDSYTVGYGNESPGRVCDGDQLRMYTNTNRSFATLITKAFHARSIILGNSGKGVVRNYGEGDKRSPKPYPFYYDKTCGEVEADPWDFSQWIPDLVVICLGTNDFSTEPYPDDSMFIGDYHLFIERIFGNYPDASLLCVATHTGPCVDHVKRVVEEQHSTYGRHNVYYDAFPESLVMDGCDYHPNIADNEAIASVLIANITDNMNWDTSVTPVTANRSPCMEIAASRLSLTSCSGILHFRVHAVHPIPFSFRIVTMHGKELFHTQSLSGHIPFDASRLASGIYFAGNQHYGWLRFSVKQ